MVDQYVALYAAPGHSPRRVVITADQPVNDANRLGSGNRTVRAEAAVRITVQRSLQRLHSILGIGADSRVVRE
ncbi:hypothetical protein D3C75_1004220 [compost metagenome]